jgi:glycine oxidase
VTTPDVLVVGGGVIGLSTAWRLSQAGVTVEVVDSHASGRASWAAAGMLTPVTEAYWGEEKLLALTIESMRRWAEFARELELATGDDVGLSLDGVLAIGLDADDLAVIDDLHALHEANGLASERLAKRACRVIEPLLSPTVRGGLFAPNDGSVDPRRVVRALESAVASAGCARIEGSVERLLEADGHVTGAVVDGEEHHAGTVVLAAGAWSSLVPGPVRPPVRPVFGEVLRLHERTPGHTPTHTIRSVVRGRHVYVVPRQSGEIVVGATSLELGYETRVTTGGVHDLLRDALAVVPGLAESEFVEHVAGLRPGTPDNAPVIGWSGVPGLFMATGHYRNGILLTPLTADAVTAALTRNALPSVVESACAPQRFAEVPA